MTSAPHISWAFKQRKLSLAQRIVLIALADRANGSRICWPSFSCIANDCEMTQRAVISAVKHLCERQLIQRVADPEERAAILARDGARSGSRSNLYRILRPLAEVEKSHQSAQPPIYEPSSPSDASVPSDYERSSPSEPSNYERSSQSAPNHLDLEGELRSYESLKEVKKERTSLRSVHAPSVVAVPIAGHQAIVDAWNAMASRTHLPQIEKLGSPRARKLSARLREHSVDAIVAGIAKVGASSFCHGSGDRGWIADFDCFLGEKFCRRAISGFYDDRTPTHRGGKPVNRDPRELFGLSPRPRREPRESFFAGMTLDAEAVT